jgi:hypothetical protein
VFEVLEEKGFFFLLRIFVFVLMIFAVAVFFLFFPMEKEFLGEGKNNCPDFDAFSSCFEKTKEETVGVLGEPREIIYVLSEVFLLAETREGNYLVITEGSHIYELLPTFVYVLGKERIYIVFSPKKEKDGDEIVKTIVFRSLRDPVPFDRIFKEISN